MDREEADLRPQDAAAPEAPQNDRSLRRFFLKVGALLTAGMLISVGTYQWGRSAAFASYPDGPSAEEPAAAVAAELGPSVVRIEHFAGQGSGVVYDEGLILTSAHVVAGASEVTVTDHEGNETVGRVVGVDPASDTGVVEVAADLPPAQLSLESPQVGQSAVAIGSPFGLDSTVTQGIVSALDRSVSTEMGQVDGLIQTDAPINPGSSGGPLADLEGRVIGINHAIASSSGGNQGVGFAVPITAALDSAEEIIAGDVPPSLDAPLLQLPGEEPFDLPLGGMRAPLRDLPPRGCGLFGLPPGQRPFPAPEAEAIRPNYIPDGYNVRSLFTHENDGEVVHRVELVSGAGDEIEITAGNGDDLAGRVERLLDDPSAERLTIDGARAALEVVGDDVVLAWEGQSLFFLVEAPADLDRDELMEMAESIA